MIARIFFFELESSALRIEKCKMQITNLLIDRIIRPTYYRIMSQQVIIEEHEMTPEMARLFEQARRNLFWFSENAERLEVFKRCRGRYVAAAGGELFVADTPEEVRVQISLRCKQKMQQA